jgi:hypothetical protein
MQSGIVEEIRLDNNPLNHLDPKVVAEMYLMRSLSLQGSALSAKVSDPSFLKSASDSQKRGCVGFRFIRKDRSNIRPFVSFSDPVFICPDIKDRSLDVVLNLVQVKGCNFLRIL